MDLETLRETPPWDWPRDAGTIIRKTLIDQRADESARTLAAELAGDLVVMNDPMADALLAIIGNADEPEQLRASAAIALGAVLELAYTQEFDDPEDVPITEPMFHRIQDELQKLYAHDGTPKEVRRRILEASVRAPAPWQQDAIRSAYSSGDREWMLTAVFSMGYVRGFDDQILEALKSGDPEIHYEAVKAAGNWELDAAWSHIAQLINDPHTSKPLLLVAIEAAGNIRPAEAGTILVDLCDSDDEDIAEAADEAMAMAQGALDWGEEDDDEDEDQWVN